MTQNQFMSELEGIIADSKTAVLATADTENQPFARWMTPVVIKDRPGAIYAVTSPEFKKARQLEANQKVQWLFQTKLLDRIASVRGLVNVIDSSALKSEVMEAIGPRLNVFWRINDDASKLVVLETVIQEATWFTPMKGVKETIAFGDK